MNLKLELVGRCLMLGSASLLMAGCPGSEVRDAGTDTSIVYDVQYPDTGDAGSTDRDATMEAGDAGPPVNFCTLTLPDVPGAVVASGLCLRKFATLGSPRMLAFAPNGDLFVAAPSTSAPGGAGGGPGGIVVLSDDNRDGVAEQHMFLQTAMVNGVNVQLGSVHGLVFGRDEIFFTTSDAVYRTTYTLGQRAASPTGTTLVTQYNSVGSDRWTHGLAFNRVTGKIYTSQSVYSGQSCPDTPRNGRLLELGQSGASTMLADGFRNPMYMRCHPNDDVCFVAELGDDGGAGFGAREKLIKIRPGMNLNYGFPCCTTAGQATPYSQGYNCALCAQEDRSIPLQDTPFGFDWEPGVWPAPYRNTFVIANHGSFYTGRAWRGAGVFFATIDPTTKVPTGTFMPLVLGFTDEDTNPLSRPADAVFAPDGRLFLADDNGNAVYWVAPQGLTSR